MEFVNAGIRSGLERSVTFDEGGVTHQGQSKKMARRALYDRPDMADDVELLAESLQFVQAPPPIPAPELHDKWEMALRERVCQLTGVSLQDLLAGRAGGQAEGGGSRAGSAASSLKAAASKQTLGSGAAGGGGGNAAMAAQEASMAREALFHSIRKEMNRVFSLVYAETLGIFDLARLNEDMEKLADLDRRRLSMLALSGRRRREDTLAGRRRQLGRVLLGGGGARKRRYSQLEQEEEEAAAAAAAPPPTMQELREAVQERMQANQPFEVVILFTSEVQQETTKAMLEDHEQLPAELFAQRLQTGQLIGQWAKDHIISHSTPQEYAQTMLGVPAAPPPAAEFNLLKKETKKPPAKKKKKAKK
jgi:hypothetical protein